MSLGERVFSGARRVRDAVQRRLGERTSPPEPPRPACAGLWDTPMVTVTGELTTCCLDEHLENRLGNINETPLAALWSSETIHRWRVAHAEGRFADSGPLCTRCNWRSAGAVDAARLENYLRETGESPPGSWLDTTLPRIRNALHAARNSHRKSG